jgi:hypothetical protein
LPQHSDRKEHNHHEHKDAGIKHSMISPDNRIHQFANAE